MKKVKDMFKKLSLVDLIIFLIPVILFGFVLYVYFPAILSPDSHNQLWQISTGIFSNAHPFIHTLLEMLCLKVWNNPASVAIFQILIFSTIWMFICKYNRKENSSKRVIIFQLLLTLIISLNPLNSTSAITLWKDILYSYLLLLLAFFIEAGIDNKFNYSNKLLIFISFITALVPHIRHNGIVSSFIFIIIIIIALLKYYKSYKWLLLIVCSFSFYLLLNIPLKVYKVEETGLSTKQVLDSKSLQYLSYLLANNRINDDDKSSLSNYVNVDKLKEANNPYFKDPILLTDINWKYLNNHNKEFYKLVWSLVKDDKKTFLTFMKKSTTVLYTLDRPNDCFGTGLYTEIDESNNDLGYKHINSEKGIYKTINNLFYRSTQVKGLNALLYNPVLYFYGGIVLAIIATIILKKKYWLCIVPNLFNVLGLTLTIPAQDTRYVYGNFFTLYLIILIIISKYSFKICKKRYK